MSREISTCDTQVINFTESTAYAALLLYGLAGKTVWSFLCGESQEADHEACWWYNVWFTACLSLPIVYRLQQGA
ncbi:hypothetical protein BD626DRAFT_563243 [Schizophyllum amplum]|uniref:Uncharacterized protein n=1 Tax=Schizophyllum amplum TaxID=97359 RepID=A0A550CXI2_9AGAR|nr:hypothetical protein BD626DRAFT_563243 [Auriculariopsis ampla]